MRKICVLLGAVFLMALMGLTDEDLTSNQGYFESGFDGLWGGLVEFEFKGTDVQLPVILNMNAQGSSGEGFLLLPHDSKDVYIGFSALTLTNTKVKSKRLSFSFDGNELAIGSKDYEPFIFDVSLKRKKTGILKGKYTFKDPGNSSGKMVFYPIDTSKPLQAVWFGNTGTGDNKEAHFLQLTQNSPVAGYVISGTLFGKLSNGDFTSNTLTGSVASTGSTIDIQMQYSTSKNLLNGTFTIDGIPKRITLLPSGIKSKKIKIKSVSPNQLTAGGSTGIRPTANTELTIKGKNFAAGAMVHFDNPGVEICCVKFINSKEIRANITVAETVTAGTQIGVRVVNPDNRQAEKASAITIIEGNGSGATVSFANDIQPVFDANCVTCHGAGGSAGLNLSPGVSYNNIVNVPGTEMPNLDLIEPGDPSNSYLIRKIKGEGISGQRMPIGGPLLSKATITRFETWVKEGALNN